MKKLQLFLVLLFLSATVLANEPSNLLTVSDVFNLETVSSPQISPDGTKIVYVRQFADIMTDKYYSNLWIINFNGSNNRPLTTGNYSDSSPRWSPDGSRLIFTSNREGSPQIYTRWMDSGQVAKLTNLQHAPIGISWSPDGKQIAFTSFVPGKSPNLIKMPAAPHLDPAAQRNGQPMASQLSFLPTGARMLTSNRLIRKSTNFPLRMARLKL